MHSVQHSEDRKFSSIPIPHSLRWRLRTIASAEKRNLRDCANEALEKYAAEKEKELGLPQQQGVA